MIVGINNDLLSGNDQEQRWGMTPAGTDQTSFQDNYLIAMTRELLAMTVYSCKEKSSSTDLQSTTTDYQLLQKAMEQNDLHRSSMILAPTPLSGTNTT